MIGPHSFQKCVRIRLVFINTVGASHMLLCTRGSATSMDKYFIHGRNMLSMDPDNPWVT